MKKFMFLAMMSALLYACSDNEDPASANNEAGGNVTFEISAVNDMKDGVNARSPLYSQDATQHVTDVVVHVFANSSGSYTYSKTFTIPNWSDGTSFMRYSVATGDKLAPGDYKFLAIGRDASDLFTITTLTPSSTNFDAMVASIAQTGDESEIFAGWSAATVEAKGGARVSISMIRKVAGVLGYFKNIPTNIDGTDVKYLRLSVTDSNQAVNLSSGAAITSATAAFNIIDMDLSGQSASNGVFVGNDLSAQSVVKVPNSQLSGRFFMPVSSVSMTLGLYDASNNALKTWVVKDTDNNETFDVLANHFYTLGTKLKAGSTDGGTPGVPGDDDNPIDLMTDQALVITINPSWETIHNLVIQ